ncbi:hypothetical protein [Microcoleus sp. CZ3-B2]
MTNDRPQCPFFTVCSKISNIQAGSAKIAVNSAWFKTAFNLKSQI